MIASMVSGINALLDYLFESHSLTISYFGETLFSFGWGEVLTYSFLFSALVGLTAFGVLIIPLILHAINKGKEKR